MYCIPCMHIMCLEAVIVNSLQSWKRGYLVITSHEAIVFCVTCVPAFSVGVVIACVAVDEL